MTELVTATVISSQPLNASIQQYILKPDHFVAYQAGQYLQIQHPEGDYFFSIANAALGSECYELHIRQPRIPYKNETILSHLAIGQTITLSLPFGRCALHQLHPNKPILFLAAGTGFAPIRAMIEQLQHEQATQSFELYWSVHDETDFYDQDKIHQWQNRIQNFQYYPHETQRRHDSLVARVLAHHAEDLKHWQIVMAGPFDLIYTLRDAFVMANIPRESIFSDAFEFE